MALPIKRNPTIAADVGSGTSPEVPTTFKVMKSELPLEPHEIVCVPGVIFSVEKLLPSNVEEAGPIVEIPEITDPVGTMMELKPVNPMTFPVWSSFRFRFEDSFAQPILEQRSWKCQGSTR
jgi:hypothetical protein